MIRAAGLAGHDVDVIRSGRYLPSGNRDIRDIDGYSRYVGGYTLAKEPDRQELVRAILSIEPENGEKIVLLPTDDYSASTIDENIETLRSRFLFPNIGMEAGKVTEVMDKSLQKSLAIKAGLPVADGWVIEIRDGRYVIPDGVRYPCFPKPQISFLGSKECMKRCCNETELRAVVDKVAAKADCPLLVEEFHQIDKEYAMLGFSDGEKVVLPAMIQLLQDGRGAHKGVTLQGKVMPPDAFADFFSKVEKFIRDLHFVGLFDVDSYESDGVLYFNELNLRFGASGYSITKLGVNLPQMLIATLEGKAFPECPQKVGRTAVFVNEKVASDDMNAGFITKSEYEDYISSADFTFIRSEDDIEPFRRYGRQVKIQALKNCVKTLLSKLGLKK